MKSFDLKGVTAAQLVERFTALALSQFKAELVGEIAKYNRLFRELLAIEEELKSRDGDQRLALTPLFAHPNPQVRLMAAEATLALAPAAARQTLQELWDRNEFPQAAFAMGTLRALERGDRKPT
jgi:Domain of unknown function (DUF2019)